MRQFVSTLLFYFVLSSSPYRALSLKCRTGNQQNDDQFRKIIQACQKRSLNLDSENNQDYNRRDTDSQETSDSNSDENLFDDRFLSSSRDRYNKNDKVGSGNRYDYFGSSKNVTSQSANRNKSYSSIDMNNNKSSYNYNSRLYFNKRNIRNSQFYPRDFGHNYSNKYNNINNSNMNRNNNNSYYTRDNNHSNYKEQGCIIQCFFNELNMVDENGFPERSAVIGVMTQNIHDPYLQDFIEESVVECYHYLSNVNREEKCQFSQNLLSCLSEKGSEKCEDWDDEYI